MNEPGRRHRGGGERRSHGAREAGPAQRRRITGGRLSGASPSLRPRPAPLPRGLHGRRRSRRRRALSAAEASVGLRFQKVRWQLGGARAHRTRRRGAGERPAADHTQAGGRVVERPRGACVRGFGFGGGGRESTGRSRAPARRFATGRDRPPDEVTGGRPDRDGHGAHEPRADPCARPWPHPGLQRTRGAECAGAQGCRPLTPMAADGEPGRSLTPVGLRHPPSSNTDPLISKKTPREESQAQARCTCCPESATLFCCA